MVEEMNEMMGRRIAMIDRRVAMIDRRVARG